MSKAFVVGNGTSRESISLQSLHEHGKIYGCNALYRDFTPDFLIAVDTKMILELNKEKIQNKTQVWTNPNKAYANMHGFHFFNPSKGWSSGPTALWKASSDGYKEIYILGFDYQGIGNNNEKVNNVYAGSNNYKRKDEKATYFGNWLKQTVITIQKFTTIQYIRVYEKNGFVPKELANLSNLSHLHLEDFQKMYSSNVNV